MSDKSLWCPCHIYLARSLKNKKDILIFEKAFISVMIKYGYSSADVMAGLSLIPAKLSVKSPVSGQSFDQYGSLNLGNLVDSVLMDGTIPAYSDCRDYYKSTFPKCEACALCEHYDGYKNEYQDTEDLLVRFLYSNERNYSYLVNCGLEPKDFQSMYNLFGVMQTDRPLVFELNKFLVRTIIESGKNRSSLFLDIDGDENFRSEYIGKKLIRALRNRSLPSDLSRGWELKYGSVLIKTISRRSCVSKEEAEILLREVKTSLRAQKKKRRTAVKDVEKPTGISGNLFDTKDESIFNQIGSENPENAVSNVENVQEQASDVDQLDDVNLLARAYENIEDGDADDSQMDAGSRVCDAFDIDCESGMQQDGGEVLSDHVNHDILFNSSGVDFTDNSDTQINNESNIRRNITDNNECNESINGEQAEVGISEIVPISEVMDENGIPLSAFRSPGNDIVSGDVVDGSEFDAIDVTSRTLDTKDLFVYPDEMPDNLIPKFCIEPDEIRHIIDLDQKNITLLTKFEGSILNAKHICCEVCYDAVGSTSFLLIYDPYTMLYYKSVMQDQMSLAVLLPIFSRPAVTVISFAAYDLCSFLRRRGGVVVDLFPIQDAFAVTYQNDRYDYYAVMEAMNIAPVYSPKQSDRLRTPVFGFITGYAKMYRSLRREIYGLNENQAEFESRRNVSEVLGYSYQTLTSQPLFTQPTLYRYKFRTNLQLRRMDGYHIHYEIISDLAVDVEYIYEQVLSRLADKGYMRAREIYVVYMSDNSMDLHCEYPLFYDMTSLVDSIFLSVRKELDIPYVQLSVSYYRIYGVQTA